MVRNWGERRANTACLSYTIHSPGQYINVSPRRSCGGLVALSKSLTCTDCGVRTVPATCFVGNGEGERDSGSSSCRVGSRPWRNDRRPSMRTSDICHRHATVSDPARRPVAPPAITSLCHGQGPLGRYRSFILAPTQRYPLETWQLPCLKDLRCAVQI